MNDIKDNERIAVALGDFDGMHLAHPAHYRMSGYMGNNCPDYAPESEHGNDNSQG